MYVQKNSFNASGETINHVTELRVKSVGKGLSRNLAGKLIKLKQVSIPILFCRNHGKNVLFEVVLQIPAPPTKY